MNAASLRDALRLVVILDPSASRGRDLAGIAAQASRGGATMLQLRAKLLTGAQLAEAARAIMAAAAIPLIINDRLDVALATAAAGCHLGADDLPLDVARMMSPPGFLLGASAGNDIEARQARSQGADYAGIGPVHVSGSKSDAGEAIGVEGFRRILEIAGLPAVAIGGITAADVPALLAAGAAGVAVISAVVGADDPESAASGLRACFSA